VYIYAVFAFLYIDADFFNSSYGFNLGENVCTSVKDCTAFIFSWSMRSSGGIGDQLIRPRWDVDYKFVTIERYFVRYIYDYSCFIIINLIFMNIIFGIIIDAFASLRQKYKRISDEQANICFVCSIHRAQFDNYAEGGWDQHYDYDHNIWDYLWFMYYLKAKDKCEYSGLESYVADQLKVESIGWIPMFNAIS